MRWKIFFLVLIIPWLLTAQQGILDRWSALLENNVKKSINSNIIYNSVDYQAIAKSPEYPELIDQLSKFNISELQTENEKLAFWINAYNIAAVKTIIDNDMPDSIKKVSTLFKVVWKQKILNIGDKNYSLGEIEHQILRKMDEPLIHFGIVCASLSCPDLIPKAYYPKSVILQLRENTRAFLRNETKGMMILDSRKLVYLSPIFKWFKDDFGGTEGVVKFLESYSIIELQGYDIRFLDYNWQLNSP